MGYYIDAQGNYYTGDRANLSDISVPPKPSGLVKWSDNNWVDDTEAIAKQSEAEALANLAAIDTKSIRSAREFLIQIDSNYADLDTATTIAGVKAALKKMLAVSSYTKEYEEKAKQEREKLK